jgi:IS5 family transposase
MQQFCGVNQFQWQLPCDPSDLSYFRKRIGEEGVQKILEASIAIHGKKALEAEVTVDTTVQEKNITFPTDSKLHRKIIEKCRKIAEKENIELRRSYTRTVKKLIKNQRFSSHPKNRKRAMKARRELKTIAGRLVRELNRKLPVELQKLYHEQLERFEKVLAQKRNSKEKIYSLHEPDVYCMSKGKEHKRYEFGAKASIALTKNSGIIVGALSFAKNIYAGHTLDAVFEQIEKLRGKAPDVAICDRGYRGKSKIGETKIVTPKPPDKRATAYQKQKARQRFRRRAGIEPIIGHLKSDHRLNRNFLKGVVGDNINLMLAAAAFNFKKLLRQLLYFFILFWDGVSSANLKNMLYDTRQFDYGR